MPFTVEQFFDVFRRYNEAIWPAQIALTFLGVLSALAAYRANQRRSWHSAQIAVNLLAAFWLWTGIVYHKVFFATINPAAEVFGSIFIAIGIALGHRSPSAPTFGTPCPTTIFTFGVLCLLARSVPRFVMAIPVPATGPLVAHRR